MMTRTDGHNHSLLSLAAASGSKNAFDIVLSALDEELERNEVRQFKLCICVFRVCPITHCHICDVGAKSCL